MVESPKPRRHRKKPAESQVALSISGQFATSAVIVSQSILDLSVSLAQRTDAPSTSVAVPFIEWSLSTADLTEDDEASKVFSKVVPLDNIAWLLSDISNDISPICEQFGELTKGEIKPIPTLLPRVRSYLEAAGKNIDHALRVLDQLLEQESPNTDSTT